MCILHGRFYGLHSPNIGLVGFSLVIVKWVEASFWGQTSEEETCESLDSVGIFNNVPVTLLPHRLLGTSGMIDLRGICGITVACLVIHLLLLECSIFS